MQLSFKTILLYWYTIRNLKAVQLYGRILLCFVRPSIDLKPAPRIANHSGIWHKPAARQPSMNAPNSFFFLNKFGKLNEVGWNDTSREKLWRYNQHYFDDLNAKCADDRIEWHHDLIKKWIYGNPPGKGVGWEAYPLSIRIINWIKWSFGHGKLNFETRHSLAVQLRWLTKNLEIHLMGNHLFVNAKALVFGGLFFEGPEADRWLEKGIRVLSKETSEQILNDGAHFELSTMYHAMALEDILDLINICGYYYAKLNTSQKALLRTWKKCVPKMYLWYLSMCHPDGQISFFNDAAFDISPRKDELDNYFKRVMDKEIPILKERVIHHKDSGYIRVHMGFPTLIIDVAKLGANYLPGHGHADVLSFEASFGKYRTIVNSGVSCYGESDKRVLQRSTVSHNTVTLNGENSSEIWRGFRCARKSYPKNLVIQKSKDHEEVSVICSHDGYKRISGKPIHTRRWIIKKNSIQVEDSIKGIFKEAIVRYHFHPSVKLRIYEDCSSGEIILPNKKTIEWFVKNCKVRLEDSEWHQSFGISLPNKRLVFTIIKSDCSFILNWK